MAKQHTIDKTVSCSGVGLHTGSLATLTFKPAPPNSGVTFYRTDLDGAPGVRAVVENVVDTSRGTTIETGTARIHTVEHVMAAAAGLGIDNLAVEVDANEAPLCDGSSLPFLTELLAAGLVEQDAERRFVELKGPVYFRSGDITLAISPAENFHVSMTIDFEHPAVGTQYGSFEVTRDSFVNEIGPARTFCFLSEVKQLQDAGLIKGGTLESAIVIGDEMVLNEDLRFPDEFVRHKILDLIGDLYLLGGPIHGHVVAMKSGHAAHVAFAREIRKSLNGSVPAAPNPGISGRNLDVRALMKVLPHRYPMLLVDRVLEYEYRKSVRAIKNVTSNEPFFEGHWPDNPVMPGVLILEAMAQACSVMIFGEEGSAKSGFFMGIEQAKFRRPVVPGDQLVFEGKVRRMRRNACKVHTKALVNGNVVCEADMTFGFFDVQ